MQKAIGHPVTPADVASVNAHVHTIAQSTHGGYCKQSAADPDILSKAIFFWWFPNYARFEPAAAAGRRPSAGSGGGSPLRAAYVHDGVLSCGNDSPKCRPLPAARRGSSAGAFTKGAASQEKACDEGVGSPRPQVTARSAQRR